MIGTASLVNGSSDLANLTCYYFDLRFLYKCIIF